MSATNERIEERAEFIKNVKIFSQLTPHGLAKLAACLKTVEFVPGEVMFREGAPGISMYIIVSGIVEVRKKDQSTGIDFLVARLSSREMVGEMALLTSKPRSATVTTVEPTVAFMLTRTDFQNVFMHDPEISLGLARTLAERLEESNKQVGIEFVNLFKGKFDPTVVMLVPQSLCLLHKVVPTGYRDNTLKLAMVNPSNLVAFDDVRRYVKGAVIEPQICTQEDFLKFMETVYPDIASVKKEKKHHSEEHREFRVRNLEDLESEVLSSLEVEQTEEDRPTVDELAMASEDAPIVRLANNILALAIQKGASDIHIEPAEKSVAIRLRIDGILSVEAMLSKKLQLSLTSRLKILARLDIAERRMPQDGRISVKLDGRTVDFRVSTVPAKFGENMVIRILDRTGSLLPPDKIVCHAPTVEKLRQMITQPYGIIYVTGPTGSGKTTTLYSLLSEINSPEIKISTVEDPIEYDLPGLCQVQTHSDIGLDFARILRAFLRQDPDVILVGETRDRETAKISVEAAITGHLVFTTLHTNDAPSAFTRLEEMGIEPFLMANSTIGVLAQRLARRLCQHCKVRTQVDDVTLSYFGYTRSNAPPFYTGEGCDQCNHTGKKGRIAIFELLVLNDEMKSAVAMGAHTEEIRRIARAHGMKTLKEYGMFLLSEGLTTVDEVLSNLVVEADKNVAG
jgi:type IV pilus assembly protein PilB